MVVVNEGAFGAVGLAVNAHAAPAPPIAAARAARTRASSYVYGSVWAGSYHTRRWHWRLRWNGVQSYMVRYRAWKASGKTRRDDVTT